ncbi:TetR/AcrR family transcriptional regulator [Alkalicoccobacillus porphyridii]|uniref:TetR/AcrR family transcriptional regulator n=1 Tax=Alkalicoccobacillus porphyridii TaxID=2597270 RepID=A0A554A256_9BACI|nr:TetR/AcrR family transcriptional regulator [Alkalicoccobacillus porphyridii]TSB47770.1 TetR/AcrR family transcriptional regulator [Alkalicoccobacillus porphyridii]
MRNKEETYKQIIETAFSMFSEKGFDQTSLSSIAAEIGISKPAIYYYFKSKDELIKSLFDTIVQEIQSITYIDLKEMNTTNVKQTLYHVGENAINHQKKNLAFNQLFNQYIMLATRDSYYAEKLADIQQEFFNTFHDMLTNAVEIKAIKDENILIKSQLLALVFDNITNFILTNMNLDYERIWREAVDSVLRGIENHE